MDFSGAAARPRSWACSCWRSSRARRLRKIFRGGDDRPGGDQLGWLRRGRQAARRGRAGGDDRGADRQRRCAPGPAGADRQPQAQRVDRDRSRMAAQCRLAALCAGRPLRRGRSAQRRSQLHRHRGLFRSARRTGRGSARGRPGDHEPRRFGQISGELVRVVKQPAQFSFVRHGEFPGVNTDSAAWRRPRASPASPWPMLCRACRPMCCGITPIMSRRRGAAA